MNCGINQETKLWVVPSCHTFFVGVVISTDGVPADPANY